MPKGGKKSRGQLSPRDKKIYSRTMWLLIGPAVFFLLYWFYAGGGASSPQETAPPEKYSQAGEPASVGGFTFLAAPGGKVFTTGEISLGGSNRVIAEGGYTFTVVPLALPESQGGPYPAQWYLVDSGGQKYDLLKITDHNPSGSGGATDPGPGNRLAYLVFKVKKDSGQLFLVYSQGADSLAWRLPASQGGGS